MQRLTSHHYTLRADHHDYSASHHRYAWPAEYDLMARIAGLRLRDRWADWHGTSFGPDSRSHVSVWERPPG